MDGFGSGYGTPPAYSDVSPLKKKWPGSYVRYSTPIPTDEPILAMELSVMPSGTGEVWASFLQIVGDRIEFWLADGVPGRNYTIKIKAQLESLQSPRWFYSVLCASEFQKYPLPPEPCPGYGSPISWSKEQAMHGNFGPVLNLQPFTVAATGSTQLTAAPVPVGLILVNSSSGGEAPGIILEKDFGGSVMCVTNVSGGPITIYPYASMTIAGLAANAGLVIQDQQTARPYINESGFVVMT